MPTLQLNQTVSGATTNLGGTRSVVDEKLIEVGPITIAASTTDQEIPFVLDVSECTLFAIVASKDMTIETNDGSSPAETLSLVAGVPYIFSGSAGDTFHFSTDITALFATNAGAEDGTLHVIALTDGTV